MIRTIPKLAVLAGAAVVAGVACDDISPPDDLNTAPTAMASAPGSAAVGSQVVLDGTASSDDDGDDLTFAWELTSTPGGSQATLSGANSDQATFTPDVVGEFSARLVVSDGTEEDTADVQVQATNTAPSALAEADESTVAVGSTVQLDGSGSTDADGHSLTFAWELEAPAGSSATLSSPDGASPSFTADVEGEYVATLTVSDGYDTATDNVAVTAVEAGDPPSIVEVGTEGHIAFDVAHDVQVVATDPEGNELSYAWSLVEGPGELGFPDSAFDTDTTRIAVSSVGSYLVEVAVSDGLHTVADTLAFEAHDPIIDGNIGTDRRLYRLLNSSYHVSGNRSTGAALTIDPGVRIEFANEAGLYAESDGSINAVGTEADPIQFVGEQETSGYWIGLGFRSNDIANELTHVEVAHGGSSAQWSIAEPGNVGVENGARVKITNASIHSSGAAGVFAESGASLPEFADNVLASNDGPPMRIPFHLMGAPDSGSSFSDNTSAYVEVFSSGVSSPMTVAALDVPYRVSGNTGVSGDMSIEPGAELEFTFNSGFYADTDGTLSAVGEAAAPIVFRGVEAEPGYWIGIGFRSNDIANELTHVEVAHGGSDTQWSISVAGNVAVETNARVKITNSTLRDGSQYGLATESGANLPDFATNTFANNAAGQVRIPTRLAGQMDGASSFSTGENAFVHVYNTSVGSDMVISSLDVPYRLGGNSDVDANLTIEAGAVLEFESGAGLYADSDGSISAVGTADDIIVFTGVSEVPGAWRGLGFRSDNLANELTYVSVGYGGSEAQWSIAHAANVGIETGARVTIRNSTIHNSAAYGVAAESSGVLTAFSENQFEGNTDASVYLPMRMAGMLDENSVFATDESGYVAIYNTSVGSDMTFSKLDVPYRISGNSPFDAAVTADPGVQFEFTSGAGFYANTDGSFAAVGTATDSITFTGVQGVPGSWLGIGFRSDNVANQLAYVDVRYGGSNPQWSIGDAANVGVEAGAQLSVSESLIRDSAEWGIWAGNNSTVTVTNVSFSGNASGNTNF